MYQLTDQKDLQPYLPNIIPGLKTSLLDPVPKVNLIMQQPIQYHSKYLLDSVLASTEVRRRLQYVDVLDILDRGRLVKPDKSTIFRIL